MELEAKFEESFKKELKKTIVKTVNEALSVVSVDKMPAYMDKGQCAKFLNISRSTLDSWIKKYNVPHVQIAGTYRFSKTEVQKWMLAKQK